MSVVATDGQVGDSAGLYVIVCSPCGCERVSGGNHVGAFGDRTSNESVHRELARLGVESALRAKELIVSLLAHHERHLSKGLLEIGSRGRNFLARFQFSHP